MIPLEELDDDAWSERSPLRPRHYRVEQEWPSSSWSFEVKEGWEDYTYPTEEALAAVIEAIVKAPKPRKAYTPWVPPYKEERVIEPSVKRKNRKHKRKNKPRRPAKQDLYEAVTEYWATEGLAPRRWTGKPNKWAQACYFCDQVVPVGYGTYRPLSTGQGWEATHWGCLQETK